MQNNTENLLNLCAQVQCNKNKYNTCAKSNCNSFSSSYMGALPSSYACVCIWVFAVPPCTLTMHLSQVCFLSAQVVESLGCQCKGCQNCIERQLGRGGGGTGHGRPADAQAWYEQHVASSWSSNKINNNNYSNSGSGNSSCSNQRALLVYLFITFCLLLVASSPAVCCRVSWLWYTPAIVGYIGWAIKYAQHTKKHTSDLSVSLRILYENANCLMS